MDTSYMSLLLILSCSVATYTKNPFRTLKKQMHKLEKEMHTIFDFDDRAASSSWEQMSKIDGLQIQEQKNKLSIEYKAPLQDHETEINASINVPQRSIHIQTPQGLIRILIERSKNGQDRAIVSVHSKEKRETHDAHGISIQQTMSSKTETKSLTGTILLKNKDDVLVEYDKEAHNLKVTLPLQSAKKDEPNPAPNHEPLTISIK